MKEEIEISHVVVSPHRAPYEEFVQFDRLKRGQVFDRNEGLFGLISKAFPINHTVAQLPSRDVWLFPSRGGKKKSLTEKEIEEAALAPFPENEKVYAFKAIRLPGEKEPLVSPGMQISQEAVKRIIQHNKAGLNGHKPKPLRKITILAPEEKERSFLSDLVKQADFDPQQLERRKEITITLENFSIDLPQSLKSLNDAEAHLRELDALEWKCRNRGETLRMAVGLTLGIREKTTIGYKEQHHEIQERTHRKTALLGYFPIFTEHHTLIIDGQERVPIVQLLPRPGLHLYPIAKGTRLCASIRPVTGPFLEIEMPSDFSESDPRNVRVNIGKHICNFRMFLKDMGFYETIRAQVKEAGCAFPVEEDVVETFQVLSPYLASRFYNQLFKGDDGYDLGLAARRSLNEQFAKSYRKIKVSPPSDDARRLFPQDIAAMFIFLREACAGGNAKFDDPLDLESKQVRLISDHLKERVELLVPDIRQHIIFYLKNNQDPFAIPLNFAERASKILDPLFKGELCQANKDTNPLSELSLKRKITLLGPKGIRNTYGAMERRGVHPSHYGRICLAETPESDKIGFNLHLALAARVEEGVIKAPYVGKGEQKCPKWLSVGEEESQTMAPGAWDEYPEHNDTFLVRRGRGKIEEANPRQITLYERYRGQFLGLGANLIPLVQHDDNNRVMMGAKNMKQALPLLYAEPPLIKTGREDLVARLSGHAVYARKGGVVESVREKKIVVGTGDGDEEKDSYLLHQVRPTSVNTITWHKPLVKKGDVIEEGQVLADGACTSKGELALGINLLCAYMPYYGLNFEDGIVISDRLVKGDGLTSLHLNVLKFDVYGDERTRSEENSLEMIPFSVTKGIFCREGEEVAKGDRLFGKYRKEGREKKSTWFKSPVNGTVIDILRQDVKPETQSPSRVRYRMICQVLEERKIRVGDKLMGRHGNKGVISRIIPAEEMPHLKDGTPVDIILNPHGVISRMNLGQILETHLGWIVKHGGEQYRHFSTVAPFERIGEDQIQDAFRHLKDSGIDEFGKAILIDGKTGQAMANPVVVGYQYIMKLNHLAEDKITVREAGAYTLLTKQPPKGRKRTGGQRIGEMEVWALQAHMAWHILQEFMSIKADAVSMRKRDFAREYFDKESKVSDAVPFQETLRVTATLLRGLCLDMTFHDSKDNLIPLDSKWLTKLDHVQLQLSGPEKIKEWAEEKTVMNPERPSVKRGKIKPVKQGLIDAAIFQDSRTHMAYIPLEEPVIHPLFIEYLLGVIIKTARPKTCPEYLKKLIDISLPGDIFAVLNFRAAVIHGPESVSGKVYYRREFSSVPVPYGNWECECGKLTDGNAVNGACPNCGKPARDGSFFTQFEAGALLAGNLLGEKLKGPLKNALLTAIPVLPTDYRPLWATHGEIHVKSELNDFYRQILEANRNLKNALALGNSFPGRKLFFIRSRLQQAVNRLMVGDEETAKMKRKSIGDRIKGKEGILRMYHLGKRVDVSARSVIVPQPELALDQVGLPLEMAAGLLRSKLIDVLADKCVGTAQKEKRASALGILENMDMPLYRDMIKKNLFGSKEGLFKDAMVLLTRAPSLHKYNILAFRPVCVDHQAIGLHPLACKFFNADFDGDEMGVFVPLSKEALEEAENNLSPLKNLLSAANGRPMLNLSQDVVLGIYLLTSDEEGRKLFNGWFEGAGITPLKGSVNGKKLADLVHKYHAAVADPSKTAQLAQKIMEEGFKRATLFGTTFSIFDVPSLDAKDRHRIIEVFSEKDWKGDLSETLTRQWNPLQKDEKSGEQSEMESPVTLMVRSGARGGMNQIVQLGALRGELTDIENHPLSPRVKRNFREGISPLEYYIGSHGARRSMCEKKLMTAKAGDFTRMMVESAYRLTIKGDDCGTKKGVHIIPFPAKVDPAFQKMPPLHSRLVGRVKVNGGVIDEAEALRLSEAGEAVYVRSVLTCEAGEKWGRGALCQKCYGWDLSNRDFPKKGLPVGILAGEFIGERGTQLTMRTFHTGGVGGGGITEGLPRIKKIFSNGVLTLPVYKVLDKGDTELEKDALVHQWTLLIAASKMGQGEKPPLVEMLEQPAKDDGQTYFGAILSDHDFDALRTVLAYETQRMYKGAVDEKHFEVIAKSMVFRDRNEEPFLVGIRGAAVRQPGFLAAASFQKSLSVLAEAALKGIVDPLEGYKERLIAGKRVAEDI